MNRAGQQTLIYENAPVIASHNSIAGPKEGQGPLAEWFDVILQDDLLGQKSWEMAESEMVRQCVENSLNAASMPADRVQAMLSGDLNNQIIASSFAARTLGIPFLGLYGACSTFVESLVLGSALIAGGFLENAICCASSHFCTAERQFRLPLEMGTQRPPQASWTATACGSALLLPQGTPGALRVTSGTVGKVIDLNITDANHMGAAMAPAVFDCIAAHFSDLGRTADDYDLIATGDLGWIGRNLLNELFSHAGIPMRDERLIDCGASLFYQSQDTHAGGSGCGCIASVATGWLMKRMERGELKRILLVGSGAMLSPTSTQQGQSIPGISYAACIEGGGK